MTKKELKKQIETLTEELSKLKVQLEEKQEESSTTTEEMETLKKEKEELEQLVIDAKAELEKVGSDILNPTKTALKPEEKEKLIKSVKELISGKKD